MIISRYLFNNLLANFLAITLVFEVVISGNVISRLLDRIAEGRYPFDILLSFWSYTVLKSLVFVLPFAAMLAVILVFTRKYRDGEIYVLFSLGFGYRYLLNTVMCLVVPLLILSLVLVMEVLPVSKMHYDYMKQSTKANYDARLVVPGKFISLGGDTVLFVEDQDRENDRLSHVFIARKTDGELVMETALRGIQKTENNEKKLYLYQGKRYQGVPNETDFQIAQFQEHWIALQPNTLSKLNFDEPDMLRFKQLRRSDHLEDRAEMQMRLAMPVSLLLLSILALLISQIPPRYEHYTRIITMIIVCLAYLNANVVVGELVMSGKFPIYPGVWTVHLIMLSVILFISFKQGIFSRPT